MIRSLLEQYTQYHLKYEVCLHTSSLRLRAQRGRKQSSIFQGHWVAALRSQRRHKKGNFIDDGYIQRIFGIFEILSWVTGLHRHNHHHL